MRVAHEAKNCADNLIRIAQHIKLSIGRYGVAWRQDDVGKLARKTWKGLVLLN